MSSLTRKVKLVRSFLAVISTTSDDPSRSRIRRIPGWQPTHHLFSADRRLELAFIAAESPAEPEAGEELGLLIGDDAEWDETQGESCMAGAAYMQWQPSENSLRVLGSIIGLPPVYVCRLPGAVAITSEIRLLHAVTTLRLAVDPQAVVELFTVGYPLHHRSLFKDVALMPGGYFLRANSLGVSNVASFWEPPQCESEMDPVGFIDYQTEAFRKAVGKLKLSDSVFSLTGGLDTRAILAVLSGMDVRLTACTISGPRTLCLDARQARDLCKAVGLPHVVVSLDDMYLRDLPAYVMEASLFSGGLASLGQAHEVYFYRKIERLGSRRLSGILGNQVGRGGVEGVARRGADLSVLTPSLNGAIGNEPKEHWLSQASERSGYTLTRSLIQRENLFSLLGNYSIGHHFMTQQHPYASVQLIENAVGGALASGQHTPFSPIRARFRDLRHRFLGEPVGRSFQRKVIAAANGFVARYPINWGWRAEGGVSLRGLALGGLALADAAWSRGNPSTGFGRKVLRATGVVGIQEIRPWREWMDGPLHDFVNDSLRSRAVANSELFDIPRMTQLLDEHYGKVKAHYETLVAALDLALAHQHFVKPSL